MNRGVVLEVKRRYSVVLTPDGQFVKVPGAANHTVGEEITYDQAVRRIPRAARLISSGIAAALVLAFVLSNVLTLGGPQVAAYVAMDINPSVEIGVTLERKVVELRALNEHGERVVEGVDYKQRPIAEVAAAIIEHAAAAHYIPEQDAEVLVTSIIVNGKAEGLFEQQLAEDVDQAIVRAAAPTAPSATDQPAAPSVEVAHVTAPASIRESAEASGVSPGKLAFYLIAEEQGLPVTIDQLKTSSVREAAEPYGGVGSVLGGKDAQHATKQTLAALLEKREAEEAAAKARAEAAAAKKAKQEAERKAKQEAERKAKQEAAKKAKAEREAERKAKQEAAKKAKADRNAEQKAKQEAAKKPKADRNAEQKAKQEAAKKAKAEWQAERKAMQEAAKKAKAELQAERKAKQEAAKKAIAEREAERKAKLEAAKKAMTEREAERKAKQEAAKKAMAERKAKQEAANKAKAEQAKRNGKNAEKDKKGQGRPESRNDKKDRDDNNRNKYGWNDRHSSNERNNRD